MHYFLFVTKKLVSVMIYPVGLTLALGFIALMMFLKKRNRAGIVLLSLAGTTLLAFSLVWTGLALLRPLESEAGPYARTLPNYERPAWNTLWYWGEHRSLMR